MVCSSSSLNILSCRTLTGLACLHDHSSFFNQRLAHDVHTQGNLHEALPVLKALLCHPGYTMQVGSCFRPCLLPFISVLVEQHVQNQKQSKNAAVAGSIMPSKDFAVALLKLLELAPHISRCACVFLLSLFTKLAICLLRNDMARQSGLGGTGCQHAHGTTNAVLTLLMCALLEQKNMCIELSLQVKLVHFRCFIVAHYFEHCPGPHSYLLAPSMTAAGQPEGLESQHHRNKQQHQHQHVDALDLAFASLLGLQLLPELRKAWGAGPYLDLLLNENEAIRWVAIQALGIQLDLVCA
eukprot:scaffold90228_cov17-Tisochrysis_lutea.AAC.1